MRTKSREAAVAIGIAAACMLLASCAGQMKRAEADLAQIEDWLPGHYDNVVQTQDDTRQRREPHTALSLDIVRVHAPSIGDHVFYVQESVADDPRRVTAQRLWSFDAVKGGHLLQTVWSLTEPVRWRDGHMNPDLFKSLMIRDANALDGCELEWKKEGARFVAANGREACRMSSAALGGGAHVEMRTELQAGELLTAELAYDAAGALVQGNASEPFYRFRKRSGP